MASQLFTTCVGGSTSRRVPAGPPARRRWRRLILIVSSFTDGHTRTVLSELDRLGAPATVLELSQFPRELALTLRYGNHAAGRDFDLGLPGGRRLALGECGAVWWRRPQPFALHPEISRPSWASFAYSESMEAFSGLWHALDAVWVNQPSRDEAAARKVFQLRVAQEIGLETPETLVTNDPEAAAAFIECRGPDRTVFKTFSATAQEWRETRLVRSEELDLLDNVRFAPVIFQEYVPGGVDVRITAVGHELFAASIDAKATAYPIDFRMDMANAPVQSMNLPVEVDARLRELMGRLGLVYGAIDMRRAADGRWVFLEINPAGQWLFVEDRTGQPITAALASFLAGADGASR